MDTANYSHLEQGLRPARTSISRMINPPTDGEVLRGSDSLQGCVRSPDGPDNRNASQAEFLAAIEESLRTPVKSALSTTEAPPTPVKEIIRDPKGTRWSIKMQPLFGETQAECQARITTSWSILKSHFVKCMWSYEFKLIIDNGEQLPSWLTADFLYRVNYGRMSEQDEHNVVWFLTDQFYKFEARRRIDTISSLRPSLWKTWFAPWSRQSVTCAAPDNVSDWKEAALLGPATPKDWKPSIDDPRPVLIGFIDPPLALQILENLYQDSPHIPSEVYTDFIYRHSLHAKRLFEFEVRLKHITSVQASMLPYAAILSDTIKLISMINVIYSHDHTLAGLDKACDIVMRSSGKFYVSDEFRGRYTPSSNKPRYVEPGYWESNNPLVRFYRKPATSDPQFLPAISRQSFFAALIFHDSLGVPRMFGDGGPPRLRLGDLWTKLFRLPSGSEISKAMETMEGGGLDFSYFDAAYICSGPFRLALTMSVDKHLSLDNYGNIHVFWDFERRNQVTAVSTALCSHFFWDHNGANFEYVHF